jgi:predicted Holliday junction resolvase-like endonuclease
MKIIYDLDSVSSAAKYLEEHNSNGKVREQIAKHIIDYMKEYAKKGESHVGTSGFLIIFDHLDEGIVCADVYVQPTFDHCFVEEDV